MQVINNEIQQCHPTQNQENEVLSVVKEVMDLQVILEHWRYSERFLHYMYFAIFQRK